MARLYAPYQHVELDFSMFTDENRHTLAHDLKAAGTTSPLFVNNATAQALLAQLVAQDAALSTANIAVAADRLKLKTDLATETTARAALDGEVRTLAALVEKDAKSPADVQGTGFVPLGPRVTAKLPPEVPDQIDTKIPKKGRGKVTVSVHETGPSRGEYVAQSSPDPIGPNTWSQLGIGRGKTRTVTGPTGTKVWVRFARVRGELQSDWSTPVLVTIP